MFFKIVAFKNSANFTGNHLSRSLFQDSTAILKRDLTQLFYCKICEFLRTSFITEHLQWLLLTVLGFQPATLLKKRFRPIPFCVNFLRTSFDRTPQNNCFLYLSVNFEKFFRTLLLQSTSGKLLILCTTCKVSINRYPDTVKIYFTGAFQTISSIFYKNEK